VVVEGELLLVKLLQEDQVEVEQVEVLFHLQEEQEILHQ
jgi:hypothetical protein